MTNEINIAPIRVVMTGPLPPAIGGMATVIDDISKSSLPLKVKLELYNTGKQTPARRSLFIAITSRFKIWLYWWQLLGREPNSLVHIHTCSGLTFFLDAALLLLAKARNIPVVLHIHGGRFDMFLDSLPAPIRALVRVLARRADSVIVLSESWRENLCERLNLMRMDVVANGVPVTVEHLRELQHERPLILFLGNLTTSKGIWELLAAAEHLRGRARIVFVGGEEEPGVGQKLKAEITARKLDDDVAWVGPAFSERKQQWLREADIFVLPSHAEGLPIALLEAMGAGLPVVVTPVGGIPAVVQHEIHGLMVPVGDVQALVTALLRLVDDEVLRSTLGAAARERCVTDFGVERVVEKLMAIYQRLLPNSAA